MESQRGDRTWIWLTAALDAAALWTADAAGGGVLVEKLGSAGDVYCGGADAADAVCASRRIRNCRRSRLACPRRMPSACDIADD